LSYLFKTEMCNMNIKECMTEECVVVRPGDTIQEAALIMAQADTGILPVGENDRLVGVVTDRDIIVRAVGAGKGPGCLVKEVMTPVVRYCFEDESVEQVARKLANIQVRRLPVISRRKRLVGIVSLGDLARSKNNDIVGRVMSAITRTAGTGGYAA
jgi:CBS domain-containing protein